MSKQNELAQLADAVTVDGSGNLDVSGTLAATSYTGSGSGLTGTGKILQVVKSQGTSSITFSQDFSAYSTIVSASITPSSTSNGILIMVQNALDGCAGGHYPALHGHIARGGTALDGMELVLYQGSTQSHRIAVIPHSFIDYPNTTSSVTYNSNWANSSGSSQSGTYGGVGNQYDTSRMFLFEIED